MTTILIIDDDVHVLGMLKKMLEHEGYDVITAPDGKEGIRSYRENPADLIITDLLMPEKDGIETIIELRRDFPEVHIIAISGGGRIDAKDHLKVAQQFEVQYTFSKPVERKELQRAIRVLLN